MAGIDGQKRGLHDMICGTRVIYEKRVKVTVVNSGVPQGSYGMPHHPMQNPAVQAESEQRQSVEKEDREAVSYTHLDVYKRQFWRRTRSCASRRSSHF